MSEFKEKVFRDLGRLENVTTATLVATDVLPASIRSAFMNLYQAALIPERFIRECDIEDPEGKKRADLTQTKDFYQAATARHQETREKMGMMRRELQAYVTHVDAMNALYPVAGSLSGADDDEFGDFGRNFDANPYIGREDITTITGIDRMLLQLKVKRSVVRVLSNVSLKDVDAIAGFSFARNNDAVVDDVLFNRYRSLYEAMPIKQAAVSDALDMYDLSDTVVDKQGSMKDFIVQFYEFVKQ